MAAPSSARSGLCYAGPTLLLGVLFALAAVASWGRLGSLLIDTGRELEVPRRILSGETLYSEIRYYWGPLAPYVNAALYAVFGVSSQVLATAGLFAAGLMCGSLFLLASRFLGPWRGVATVVPFLFLGAFSRLVPDAIFNFVLPFNFDATYGVALATFSVALLVVSLRSATRAPYVVSALGLALVGLTKVELVLAVAAAHLVYLSGLALLRRLRAWHLIACGGALALVGAVYGCFHARVGAALWTANVGALFNEGSRHYVRETMGLAAPLESLTNVAASLGALGALAGLAWLLAAVAERWRARTSHLRLLAAATGAAAFGAYALLPVSVPYAALPVLGVVALAGLAYRAVRIAPRDPVLAGEVLSHLVLWVFAVGLLGRVILRSSPMHYGFFLLPPGIVCLGVLVFEYLPRLAGGRSQQYAMFGATAVGLLLGTLVTPIRASAFYFGDDQVVELRTPTTRMLLHAGSPELTIVPILQGYPADTRVIAVPEGAGLVFASGRRSGDHMSSYLPMELPAAEESALLQRWKSAPPDVIVWWRRDELNHGYEGFGVDYAVRLAEWIEGHYAPVTDPSAFMFVLARTR
jgi:hypothetical protein